MPRGIHKYTEPQGPPQNFATLHASRNATYGRLPENKHNSGRNTIG